MSELQILKKDNLSLDVLKETLQEDYVDFCIATAHDAEYVIIGFKEIRQFHAFPIETAKELIKCIQEKIDSLESRKK